jgi:hypothetical protein
VCAGVDGRGAGTVDEQAGAAVSQARPLRLLERGQRRGVGIRSGDIGRQRGSWPWKVCVCDAAPRLRTEGCLRDVLGDLRAGGRVSVRSVRSDNFGRRVSARVMSYEGNIETSRCCLLGSRKRRESFGTGLVDVPCRRSHLPGLASFALRRQVDEKMTASDSRRVGAYEMSSQGGAGTEVPAGMCVSV